MGIRQGMLLAARRGALRLREEGIDPAPFLAARLRADGGFRGRGEESDLYYTSFAVGALGALEKPLPAGIAGYLRSFGDGASLDLVHLACLARSWAEVARRGGEAGPTAILARIESFRAADGGYSVVPPVVPSGGPRGESAVPDGSAYGCFLALGAYQDLDAEIPGPERLESSLRGLEVGGAYANDRTFPVPSILATAAAAIALIEIGRPVAAGAAAWIAGQCEDGGFRAFPDAPFADLLSTAAALHALAALGGVPPEVRGPGLRFVRSLLGEDGGFRGIVEGDEEDCEYTFYGLIALGHLASP
jgi:hypothetical protein